MPDQPPDLDQSGKPIITKPPDLDATGLPETPSPLSQVWKFASSPLTTKPAEAGKQFADWYTKPTLAESPTGQGGLHDFMADIYAREKGFLGGAAEGLGNVVSEFTSPINLAMMGLGGGENIAAKTGLPEIARLLGYGAKASSIPFAVHGAGQVLSPESTLAQRGTGLAEMAGGLAGMIHTLPTRPGEAIRPGEVATAPEVAPEAPIRPPVNPAVADSITENAPISSYEDILGPNGINSLLITPDGIQASFKAGKINQSQAVRLLEKYYKEEVIRTKGIKPVPALAAATTTTEGVTPAAEPPAAEALPAEALPAEEPANAIHPNEIPRVEPTAYIVPKNNATPKLINEARSKGYEFAGLNDRGDFRFRKTITPTEQPITTPEVPPVVAEPTSIVTKAPTTLSADEVLRRLRRDIDTSAQKAETREYTPLTAFRRAAEAIEAPNVPQPPDIQKVVDLIASGKVANVAQLQREIGISYAKTKPLWYAAKKQIQDSEMPPGFFTRMGPQETGVAAIPEGVKPEIPPVAPLTQLPTPKGLAKVIKDIPETGNAELDSAVTSLRAMRRRKGIDQFNDLETQAYNGLMDKVRNHPALPEELRSKWNTIVGESSAIIGVERPSALSNLISNEKGELVISPGKEAPKKVVPKEVPVGKVAIVKSGRVTPEVVKSLFNDGFRFLGENSDGDLRFKRVGTTGEAPILESEVGTARPTSRGAMGDLGAIQDAQKSSAVMEAFNLPRGILASWDLSAPLRQGIGLIHKKAFWTSMKPMMESLATEEGFQASQERIASRALYKKRIDPETGKVLPSFADDTGLKLTDLTNLGKREEAIMSTWAEKVPGVRASNRAYTAFLNNLRADTFESLIRSGKIFQPGVETNLPLARALADFVNTGSGRGSLGSLERSATILNTGLFAPRLIASRLKMLNPMYYIFAPPMVRKEALKSLFALAATGNTVLQLAKMAGAEVVTDPNNSDFGKATIGNVRIDPWGGFQQYVIAANRLVRPSWAHVPGLEGGTKTGITGLDLATGFLGGGGQTATSSTSGRQYDLWNPRGPYDPTHLTIGSRFLQGKTNPAIGFAWNILAGQKEMSGQKMDFTNLNPMNNSIAQRFIPLVMQDIYQVAQEEPELLPITAPLGILGMGVQTYGQQK